MSSLSLKMPTMRALRAKVTEDTLAVDLSDGRTLSAPLAWYPRLLYANPEERNNWRLIAGGEGIHWPDLDEDLSVESIVMGRASGESQASLKRWIEGRRDPARRRRVPRPKSPRPAGKFGVTLRKSQRKGSE